MNGGFYDFEFIEKNEPYMNNSMTYKLKVQKNRLSQLNTLP